MTAHMRDPMFTTIKAFTWWLAAMTALPSVAAGSTADAVAEARQLMNDGNVREALQRYRELVFDPAAPAAEVAQAVTEAASCYQQLNEAAEIDAFLADVLKRHDRHWQVLAATANALLAAPAYGFEISGAFRRGDHRGGGKLLNSSQRDRVVALGRLVKAVALLEQDSDALREARQTPEGATVLDSLAELLLRDRQGNAAWRLQDLTDLETLPDYDEGWGRDDGSSGAAVDEQGDPVVYDAPRSWQEAKSDGERWRWTLAARSRWQPAQAARELVDRAVFLNSQFGVETLAEGMWRFGGDSPPVAELLQLHGLGEDETLARLATGIKRFRLPAEHNPLSLLRRAAELGPDAWRLAALRQLTQILENRRQYPQAAEVLRQILADHPQDEGARQQLEQIVQPWGRLEPAAVQPAGRGATIDYRFRNGKQVEFVAREINVRALLDDVKRTIRTAGQQLDWDRIQVQNLGYRLLTQGDEKYLGRETARWKLDLDPPDLHFDKRETVATPLQKPGAYLLTATMASGNVHQVVIWVADTAIVKKPMENGALYYVADAASGQPVARCNVEFFGFSMQHGDGGRPRVLTKDFAELTDANGLVELPATEEISRYQWLAIAATDSGRLAFLGYNNVWTGGSRSSEFRQVKAFALTDRPVYRPGQPVHFKFWVRAAQYDLPAAAESEFAAQAFQVEIRDPRNEKAYAQTLIADAYGGLSGTWQLPDAAPLGQYQFFVVNHGGGTFRVEEYKKPEFEVAVVGPDRPVQLGEKIAARIQAKYYFGEPVAEGVVRYKVLRTTHADAWFPPSPWDWLYGPGYWWFAESYDWYPGWARWGCHRPHPWWIPRPTAPPELVAQREARLNAEGFVEVEIDTAIARQIHPDEDHRYQIEAEVVDPSRRTIVATGSVIAARQPFRVTLWTNRGFVRAGDSVLVQAAARTPDGKPVRGSGLLRLMRIAYAEGAPVETEAARWELDANEQGLAELQITAAEAGQYRLSYEVKAAPAADAPAGTPTSSAEGGAVLTIRGPRFTGEEFRFNDLEIIPERREYAPGDKVALQVSADQPGATVLLFVRAENGVYPKPQIATLQGKSTLVELDVLPGDAPNFFVEGVVVHRGRVHAVAREIFVPPANRVIDVEVFPSATAYQPGQEAEIQLKLTDGEGRPVVGSVAAAIYDKALDYVAGGAAPPDIREFFWKWRRGHQPSAESNLDLLEGPVGRPNEPQMGALGVFGETVADAAASPNAPFDGPRIRRGMAARGGMLAEMALPAAAMAAGDAAPADGPLAKGAGDGGGATEAGGGAPPLAAPTVRQQFADTALWIAHLESNSDGIAKLACRMPENLTSWRVRAWAVSHGTRVGEGSTEVVTRKNLLVRLQTPRFLVDRDEVVLSANVHNYLPRSKQAVVRLELEGGVLAPLDAPESSDNAVAGNPPARTIDIEPGGQARVDWRVRAVAEGRAVVRVLALTDEESDAMQLEVPTLVHGMLKTESFSSVLRPEDSVAKFELAIPADRRPEQTRLEVRFSPTLAGAMLDAIPYLIDYPYGCTEQTLNRFLPAVLAQRALQRMGVDLAQLRDKRTNLNAQELGDADERSAQWRRYDRNPVFDEQELAKIVKTGVNRLTEMQLESGGWGWFSGWGEHPSAHTTAVVLHGLHAAADNDVAVVPSVLERGRDWLLAYQSEQLAALDNWDREANAARDAQKPAKPRADHLDALVAMVLAEAGRFSRPMGDYLYQDRTQLSPYSLAALGMAVHREAEAAEPPRDRRQAVERRTMILRNLSQFLRQDPENQTAWLDLPGGAWWTWYGSEYETQACYLQLLVAVDPRDANAPRLVKYLLNNRKHGSRWNSTRDTALVLEAFADFLAATDELRPDLTVEVWIDGIRQKEVRITPDNLLTFDGGVALLGDQLATGRHVVEIRKQGRGPLYCNAYLTNFTLEDPIAAAGLEIKVQRTYYKLVPVAADSSVAGGRGQSVRQNVDKYRRVELVDHAPLESGDLVEVELSIDSKNDYEYLVFADPKAAGFEPVEVRSGYNGNALGAYVEYRDQQAALFVARLPRGSHSVAYRLRAEIPGRFSALPAQASAMYAPELKANSHEFKAVVVDKAPATTTP